MRPYRRHRILLVTALATALALGCKADTSGLSTLTLDELRSRLGEASAPILCDVNNADTRERHGVIPGALLLTSYRDYLPHDELPPDRARELVFYCHSERCGAAASAARKATAAGYSRVSVLPAGIRGWASSGLPVDPAPEG